jgi:anti-sigma regulatory factor (Ser/Thr protein kinase)
MSEDRLTPLPHIIKSIRALNWNLAGALMELIDNSLQHGKAKEITIVIDNATGIAINDNGIGVDDINRIFRLGDASAYDDLAQIGQYGVGATNATIYLGDNVQVQTVRDGRKHIMSVDWAEVDRSHLWPLRYKGVGTVAKRNERGTQILIRNMPQYYQLVSTERAARDMALIFAPALRAGAKIWLYHQLGNGRRQLIEIAPFTPVDLTDEMQISGEIQTIRGPLRWSGRAGLSASLVDKYNGVHIAFQHRVIETTRDPFQGRSAPTLYVEVQLDHTTPWKHMLAQHKDKVVRERDPLMDSIFTAIEPLLKRSEKHAESLALNAMLAPIENDINKALRSAGILAVDPEEEPTPGGLDGEEAGVINPSPTGPNGVEARTPVVNGEPAKPTPQPTGVRVEYKEPEKLEGKGFSWEVSDKLLIITLDKSLLKPVLGWPIKVRDEHVKHLIVSFVSHAIEADHMRKKGIERILTKAMREKVLKWADEEQKIAPYLYAELLRNTTPTSRSRPR